MIESKYISLHDGTRIHYLEQGSGETLLLLHGYASWSYTWQEVFPLLADKYHLLAPDLMGFGLSDKPKTGQYEPAGFAAQMEEFLQKKGIGEVTVIGNSVGGWTALEMASRYPFRVDRLVLAASAGAPSRANFHRQMFAALFHPLFGALLLNRVVVRRILKSFAFCDATLVSREKVEQYYRTLKMPGARHGAWKTLRMSPHMISAQLLGSVRVPTLNIWGKEDLIAPIEEADTFQAIPNSRLTVLEHCGHMPQEEAPERFVAELTKFLQPAARGERTSNSEAKGILPKVTPLSTFAKASQSLRFSEPKSTVLKKRMRSCARRPLLLLLVCLLLGYTNCGGGGHSGCRSGGDSGSATTAQYVFVANSGDTSVGPFALGATGTLTAGTAVKLSKTVPYDLVFDPKHQRLFVQGPFSVSVMTAGSNGSMAEMAGSPLWLGPGVVNDIAVHPSGDFLFVATDGPGISTYRVTNTTTPLTKASEVQYSSHSLAIDTAGKYLYALTSGSQALLGVFAINASTGALTPIKSEPRPGAWLCIRRANFFTCGIPPQTPTLKNTSGYSMWIRRRAR